MGALSLEELAAEVQALRAALWQMQALGPRYRLRLSPVEGSRFLGQPLTINARLTDSVSGEGVMDAPVTFIVSSGLLSGADGYAQREGRAITLRSDVDGNVRLTLVADTLEPLTRDQEHALEAALSLLDAAAETPSKARDGLVAMAREYRWEANYLLRQAIDIFFRERERALVGTVNSRDHRESWQFREGSLVAHARRDEPGEIDCEVFATAVLEVRFKDWLGPWFDTYLELSQQDSPLGADFKRLKERTKLAAPLLESVYARTRDYVEKQPGIVGELVAQRVAERSLDDFVQSGVQDLEVDERLRLQPVLEAAARTISRAGVGVIATVGQTQGTLRKEIEGRGSDPRLTDLLGQVGALSAQLAKKVDLSVFNAELAKKVDSARFQSELATKVDSARFQSELATKVDNVRLQSELATKVDSARLQAELARKLDTARYETEIARKLDVTRFETEISRKLDVAQLDQRISSLRVDVNRTIEERIRTRPT